MHVSKTTEKVIDYKVIVCCSFVSIISETRETNALVCFVVRLSKKYTETCCMTLSFRSDCDESAAGQEAPSRPTVEHQRLGHRSLRALPAVAF